VEHQKVQAKQASKSRYDGNYSRAKVPTYLVKLTGEVCRKMTGNGKKRVKLLSGHICDKERAAPQLYLLRHDK